VLASTWLYARALGFAYFNDDPTGHFAWMEGQTLGEFFASSADCGYYRPVVFAVLRLTEWLFGNATFPHHPVADHALLLLLHAANTALVGALALALTRRAGRSPSYAFIAALVFAFVPFSYEAVGYVASLTHPLLLLWLLLTLLLFERRWSNPQWASISSIRRQATTLAALACMCLGLLTHENGLFIFPALVGLDWVARPAATIRERARRLWPYAIPPLLFVGLWLLIPKNSGQGLNDLDEVGRNLVPFLQTLVYPLLPLFRLDAGDTTALLVLAAAVMVVSGLLAWRAGAPRLWVFALSWWFLSLLPAALFLDPAYVYGSPRLSYLPAVGVALLWAMPGLWVASGRWQVVGLVFSVIYAIALILPALPFIRCQLDFYDETSRFAREMAAAGQTAPADRELVFVNLPFFFSSTPARPAGCPSPYPWTPIGGILIPPYAQPGDFVRFNGGPQRPTTGVALSGYGAGWRAFGETVDGPTFRTHAAEDAVYVFDLLRDSLVDLSAVWQPGAAEGRPALATFGETLEIVDAQLQEANDQLVVQMNWRVAAPPTEPLTAFVHVYDTNGALVAQHDGPIGDGVVPSDFWAAGDGLRETRTIDLTGLPAGAYFVAAGVYRTADGTRLPAAAGRQALPEDIYLIGAIER
jgi:hypothetical protein